MRARSGLALLALAIAAAPALASEPPDYGSIQIRQLDGKPAPPFALPDLDGKTVRLEDFRGKVLLLFFWATWCPFCREELPGLLKVARPLESDGLAVLLVDIREGEELVRRTVQERGYHARVALDRTGDVAGKSYGVWGTPTVVLVDRQGRMIGYAFGSRNWDSQAGTRFLANLLEQK